MHTIQWQDKVEQHISKGENAIEECDAGDLIHRAVRVGENSANLLRLCLDGTTESTLYLLMKSLAKFFAARILDLDYSDVLARAYELHRENAYVTSEDDDEYDDDDIDFDEAVDIFTSLTEMASKIKTVLTERGFI